MKKTFLLLVLCLAGIYVYAQRTYSNQEFEVKFGFPYELPKGYKDLGYFGDLDKGFVQLSYRPKTSLKLQLFDKNLKVSKTSEIDIKSFPSDFVSEGFFEIGGKYYWLYSHFIKPDNFEILAALEIDIENGKIIGAPKQLVKQDRLTGEPIGTGMYGMSFGIKNKYKYYMSYDNSKLLITYRLKHKEKNDRINKEEVGFLVLGEGLDVITDKVIEMPYTESKMENEDYAVDSKGNSYLLAKVYETEKKKERKGEAPSYHIEVFRLKGKTEELSLIPLKQTSNFIRAIFIHELESGTMVIGGFYSKIARGNSSDGVYLAKINSEGVAAEFGKGYYEFPIEVLKSFLSERQQRKLEKKDDKGDVEAKNLVLRKIVATEGGGLQVFGEVYYVVVHRDANGRERSRTYYYEDILAMSIGGNGEVEWIKKIAKRQKGGGGNVWSASPSKFTDPGRGSMGFGYYKSGENTYLFYTDNIKNIKLPLDKEPEYHTDGAGGYLVYYKIDGKGNTSKGDLFNYREEEIKFEPADLEYLGVKTMVNRAFNGRLSRVVMLKQK